MVVIYKHRRPNIEFFMSTHWMCTDLHLVPVMYQLLLLLHVVVFYDTRMLFVVLRWLI